MRGARSPRRVAIGVCLVLLAGLLAPAKGFQQGTLPVDYVFLVDISGSMAGGAGHKNIFGDVRSAVRTFVASLDSGTNVLVLPFDAQVRERRRFTITDATSRAAFDRYLNGLQADGESTGVYRSIAAALEEVQALRASSGDRIVVFHVYTDGDDNVSREWTLERILRHFTLKRGPLDWMFYTEIGLPENAHKRAAFNQTPQTRYQNTDDVRPITQVRTLLPTLHFGNIKESRGAARTQRYDVKNRSHLPAGLTLRLSSDFPELRQSGVLAQVTASVPGPDDAVSWNLALVNAESLPDGRYAGEVIIEPSDPTVLVVPNRVRVAFTHEEPHFFTVGTTVAVSEGVLDLGELGRTGDPHAVDLPIAFSATAIAARDEVVVELVRDPDSASALPPAALSIEPAGVIPVSARQLRVRLRPSADVVRGTYTGTLRFRSQAVEIRGPDLRTSEDGSRALAWSVTVPRAPIPLWVWLAAGLALAGAVGFVAYSRLKPPLLPDLTLDVTEPDRQTLVLSGLPRAVLGAGAELLPQMPVSLEFVPVRRGKEVGVLVRPLAGEWQLKQQGSRSEQIIIADQKIFDGDLIRASGCRLRVSSFALIRADVEV